MSSQITFYTSTRIFVQNFRLNMVTAIDWCSHTTHNWISLVICFGLNGPLRQYFSLYRAVSQRVRKKREKIDERKKFPNNPHPHLLQVQQILALCEIISSLDSLLCPGDSIKRLFDVFDINLKNKLKRKVKERKLKEGKKGEKRHIV